MQKLIADKKIKRIKLDADSAKPYLRIRPRLDREGGENDRSRSNVAEVKLRLQDIVRLEVGKDKSNSSHNKPIKIFSLVLRTRSKQLKTFNFEAESLTDRDIIVSGIKSLLERHSKKRGSESSHLRKNTNESTRSERTIGQGERDQYLSRRPDSRNDNSELRGSGSQGRLYSDDSSRDRNLSNSSSGNSREDMKVNNDAMYQRYGCNAFACQSEALGAVADTEYTAKFANQSNGVWCTDDICSGGLNDFRSSVEQLGVPDMTAGMSLLSVPEIFKAPAEKVSKIIIKKQRLQNRARHSGAKARRLHRLRCRMTFEGIDNPDKMPYLKTIKSCDEYGLPEEDEAILTSFDSRKDIGGEETELYYDSDPEDARECTFRRLGPRGTLAEKQNKSQDDSALGEQRIGTSMIPLYDRKWKKVDDAIIMEIIENLKNQTLNLMWHPTQSEERPNQPPVCVKVWVENGVYLTDGTFLLPKLTWVPIHESKVDSFVMNAAVEEPGSLDLLDVCRVRECSAIDRKFHPYASVDRSFLIQTQSGTTLFETRSKQERSHIVNGMKLLIARLASLLMLRDLRAVDEFFGGNSVPGEAPWWAKSENESSESGPPGLPGM